MPLVEFVRVVEFVRPEDAGVKGGLSLALPMLWRGGQDALCAVAPEPQGRPTRPVPAVRSRLEPSLGANPPALFGLSPCARSSRHTLLWLNLSVTLYQCMRYIECLHWHIAK